MPKKETQSDFFNFFINGSNRDGKNVKETVKKNPLVPTQQLYEQERAKVKTNALLAGVEAPILPDYLDRKGRFIRHRKNKVKKNMLKNLQTRANLM